MSDLARNTVKLGTQLTTGSPQGRMGLHLADRIWGASQLWMAGDVKRLVLYFLEDKFGQFKFCHTVACLPFTLSCPDRCANLQTVWIISNFTFEGRRDCALKVGPKNT